MTVRKLRHFPYVSSAVITGILIFTLVPVYWLITSALKSSPELTRIPVTLWPHHLSLEQVRKVLDEGSVMPAILRSLYLAVSSTSIVVVLGSMASYAVVYLKYRFRRALLGLSLVTQLLPQAATLVPVFLLYSRFGLIDHLPAVTLAYVGFQLPVAVWLIHGYFASVPRAVVEAAEIDGSGPINTLLRVVMPVAAPGVAAAAIWSLIGIWSELLFALILLSGTNRTVPVALAGLIGEHTTDTGLLLAASAIVALPPLVLFFVFQRYFVAGLSSGSVKG